MRTPTSPASSDAPSDGADKRVAAAHGRTARARSTPFGVTGTLRAVATAIGAANAVLIRRRLPAADASATFTSLAAANMVCTALIGGITTWALAHHGLLRAGDRRGFLDGLYRRLGGLSAACVAIAVTLAVAAAPDAQLRGEWALIAASMGLLRCADMASSESLRASGQVRASNILAILGPLALAVVVQLATSVAPGPTLGWTLLGFAACASIGLAILGWLLNPFRRPHSLEPSGDPGPARVALGRTGDYYLAGLVTALAGGLDLLVAPRLLGVDEAASYVLGVRASLLVSFPVIALGISAAPRIAAARGRPQAVRGSIREVARATRRALAAAAGLYLTGLAVWATLGREVIGSTSLASMEVYALLGVAHLANVAFGPTIALLGASRRPRQATSAMLAGLISLLVGIAACTLVDSPTGVLLAGASFAQLLVQNIVGDRLLLRATGQSGGAWRRMGSEAADG